MQARLLPPLTSPYTLSQDSVDHYAQNGWVRLSSVCSPAEVEPFGQLIREVAMEHSHETRPLEERDTYGKAFLQVTNLWRLNPTVAAFTLSPRFAGIAAKLIGCDRVRLFHDQALFKEPGGGHTPWHQDGYFWPLNHARTVTMWMPLVDVSAEVGTMSFADQSHKEGLVPLPTGISDLSEAFYDGFVLGRRFSVRTSGAMSAGDATFHSGLTLHRAPGNPSDRVRAVMTVIYVAADETVQVPLNDAQQSDLGWLPGLKPGDKIDTPINPLL